MLIQSFTTGNTKKNRKNTENRTKTTLSRKRRNGMKQTKNTTIKNIKNTTTINREATNEKHRNNYQANREKVLANQTQKITCGCGSICRKGDKTKHENALKTSIMANGQSNKSRNK